MNGINTSTLKVGTAGRLESISNGTAVLVFFVLFLFYI